MTTTVEITDSGPISPDNVPDKAVRCQKTDTEAHGKRPVGADGLCYTCHYAERRRKRKQARAGRVRRLYGLSERDLVVLTEAQRSELDGKVKCRCGRTIGITRSPHIDHWHGCPHCSGKGCRRCVRGLLCQPCNVVVGYVRDQPEAFIRLAWHVATMPAQQVLTALDRGDTLDTFGVARADQESVPDRQS